MIFAKKRCWLYALAVLLVVLCTGCGSAKLPNAGQEVVIKVQSGMHSKEIAELLVQKGVLPTDNYFALLSRVYSLDKNLQAGYYKVRVGMSSRELIGTISKGAVLHNTVTIPEGMYVPQVAELLAQNNLVDKQEFLNLAKSYAPYEYMKSDNSDIKFLVEGFLFPDTYQYPFEASAEEIMKIMVDEFDKRMTTQMRDQVAAKGMDVRTWVTKASLVEKEARRDEDRPIIAGVFENRLRLEMPLQCDATVQYELGYAKFPLLYSDLKIESAYNTYIHTGLPPGPIGNPGKASLQSVLNPTSSDYLFFVADKNGKYYYTKTFEEHQNTVDSIDLGY